MKEETVGGPTEAKCLERRELGARERDCPFWQIEDVPVPMECRERVGQGSEERVAVRAGETRDGEPAELFPRARRDARAERRRKELRAETHAEDGRTGVQRALEQPLLLHEVWVKVAFVDADGPTHDDQTRGIAQVRGNRFPLVYARDVDPDAARGEQRRDAFRSLDGNMLKHANATIPGCHAADGTTPPGDVDGVPSCAGSPRLPRCCASSDGRDMPDRLSFPRGTSSDAPAP